MSLTRAEMAVMIETLKRLCDESRKLQKCLKQAMAEQARAALLQRDKSNNRR